MLYNYRQYYLQFLIPEILKKFVYLSFKLQHITIHKGVIVLGNGFKCKKKVCAITICNNIFNMYNVVV